jgi:hypothetical protein
VPLRTFNAFYYLKKDHRCGDDRYKNRYLELYQIAINREVTVADYLDVSNGSTVERFYSGSSRLGARVHGFFLGGSVCC